MTKDTVDRIPPNMLPFKWYDISLFPQGKFVVDILSRGWSAEQDAFVFHRSVNCYWDAYNRNEKQKDLVKSNLRPIAFMFVNEQETTRCPEIAVKKENGTTAD
jgi:hypothetical protein